MNKYSFINRHLGPRPSEVAQMLETIGVASIEQLITETIPDDIRLPKDLDLPKPMSEQAYMQHIETLAHKNKQFRSFIGLIARRSLKNHSPLLTLR